MIVLVEEVFGVVGNEIEGSCDIFVIGILVKGIGFWEKGVEMIDVLEGCDI